MIDMEVTRDEGRKSYWNDNVCMAENDSHRSYWGLKERTGCWKVNLCKAEMIDMVVTGDEGKKSC